MERPLWATGLIVRPSGAGITPVSGSPARDCIVYKTGITIEVVGDQFVLKGMYIELVYPLSYTGIQLILIV